MIENLLVAEPGEPGPFSGTFLLNDVVTLGNDLRSGNWVSAGLGAVPTAIDLAATISDPFGSLIAAGFGWLEDHFEPLKGWLEDLTGSPGEVEGFAGTWENVAERLREEVANLARSVERDLGEMVGSAIATYQNYIDGLARHIEALAEVADSVAGAMKIAAGIVEFVHGLVRDVIAQLVGAIISWAAEEFFSLGLATPWVLEQVSTRVAQLSARVGTSIRELISSVERLKALIEKLDDSVGDLRELLQKMKAHPDVARGRHTQPWLEPREYHPPRGTPSHSKGLPTLRERIKEELLTDTPRDIIGGATSTVGSSARPEDGT